jgi:hypothetical protein
LIQTKWNALKSFTIVMANTLKPLKAFNVRRVGSFEPTLSFYG